MTEKQASRLLTALFEGIDHEQPIRVLDLGPALSETVSFLSRYRCKLHFADLYDELPLQVETEPGANAASDSNETYEQLDRLLEEALPLPAGSQFDLIFFWDVFNFLSREVITLLMDRLRPHLYPHSRAHCFAVHNSKTPMAENFHGIIDESHLSVRRRTRVIPNYQPHPQGGLVSMLHIFEVDRSVLMPDRRVELLLKAKL